MLEVQSHRVIAPDLPGIGEDPTPLNQVTLDLWAHFVSDLVNQQDEKVILVEHSRGGIVISQAVEYCSENILGLVYLCAFLIPDGKTLWETLQMRIFQIFALM